MVYKNRRYIIWVAFGAGKLQRINSQAIKQRRHPDFLAVRLIERKIAVDVPDRARAGEVRVGNLLEHVSVDIVDVASGVGSNK